MARVFFQICSIAPYNGQSTFHHEVSGCYVPVCKSKHTNMGSNVKYYITQHSSSSHLNSVIHVDTKVQINRACLCLFQFSLTPKCRFFWQWNTGDNYITFMLLLSTHNFNRSQCTSLSQHNHDEVGSTTKQIHCRLLSQHHLGVVILLVFFFKNCS